MTTSDQMRALVKQHGAVSFAKVILSDPEKYSKALTETEFVDLLMVEARSYQKTGESAAQSFSRMFSSDTPEALLLRQAHTMIKQANRAPMATAQSVSDGSAYDKLVAKAKKLLSESRALVRKGVLEDLH